MVVLGHLQLASAMRWGSLVPTKQLQIDPLRNLVLGVVRGHLAWARAMLWGSRLPTKPMQNGPSQKQNSQGRSWSLSMDKIHALPPSVAN